MKRGGRNIVTGIGFAMPWLIGMGVFLAYPIGTAIYYSFTDLSLIGKSSWIGLANFGEIFTDAVFGIALRNTLWYVVVIVPLMLVLSLLVALFIYSVTRARAFFRALFYAPVLLPIVVVALVWRWLLNGDFGVLRFVLSLVAIESPPWLASPAWIKDMIVMMQLFLMGQTVVLFYAGLLNVPQSLYEAAVIDGAGWWSRTRRISIPLISPMIQFNLLLGLIDAVQVFALPYALTQNSQFSPIGGPARSTTFLITYVWQSAFSSYRMGYACAISLVVFLIVLSLTLVSLRLGRRFVFHMQDL